MPKSSSKSSKKSNGQALFSVVLVGIILVVLIVGAYMAMQKDGVDIINKRLSEVPSTSLPLPSTTVPDVAPPVYSSDLTLSITSPTDKEVVNTPTIAVTGKTSPRAEVFVNDKESKADTKGSFSVLIPLDEGDNIISISVNDDVGNYASEERIVTYEPAN